MNVPGAGGGDSAGGTAIGTEADEVSTTVDAGDGAAVEGAALDDSTGEGAALEAGLDEIAAGAADPDVVAALLQPASSTSPDSAETSPIRRISRQYRRSGDRDQH